MSHHRHFSDQSQFVAGLVSVVLLVIVGCTVAITIRDFKKQSLLPTAPAECRAGPKSHRQGTGGERGGGGGAGGRGREKGRGREREETQGSAFLRGQVWGAYNFAGSPFVGKFKTQKWELKCKKGKARSLKWSVICHPVFSKGELHGWGGLALQLCSWSVFIRDECL